MHLLAVLAVETLGQEVRCLLAFKQAAAGEGLCGRLAPIPRQLSAGCGMAWLEPEAAAELLDSLAQRSGIVLEQAVVLEL